MRLVPARLSPADVVRIGSSGLRARPLRMFLSALGIAIGIGAMISVVGISASSRVDLERQLAALGTNLLVVGPGQSLSGEPSHLPRDVVEMVSRVGPITLVTATGRLPAARVYRNDRIPTTMSGGISVLAARTDLLPAVGGKLRSGTFLNPATERYPAVVLGAAAAPRLGVSAPGPKQQVWLGGQWFTVVGILRPVSLVPDLDNAALIGWPIAKKLLHFDGFASTVYTRSREDSVEAVRAVLARSANPESPEEVTVSRPSDALAAKRAADKTLNALLLGLGGVALLVGGVGIANTMVISVLERRAEIGLRRALGATQGHVRLQFLAEALLLSALGGIGGIFIGIGVTTSFSLSQGWPTVVPPWASVGALASTLIIGALAGLYPALRAARMAPTEALASS